MGLLSLHLTLLVGPTLPVPAPPQFMQALQGVEVTHSEDARSGFQLTFQVGRGGTVLLPDFPLLANPLLEPMNRVILVVTMGALPRVLMDGIITERQLSPGGGPGESVLTVTGEDVSVMMDLDDEPVQHPAQSDDAIAAKIIASYACFGLVPTIVTPRNRDTPSPNERVPQQRGTDLDHLIEMAGRHAYVFYITPGPVVGFNRAYWGPPVRVGVPQRALSVNMGPQSNVDSLNFRLSALTPTLVSGKTQERDGNRSTPVQTFISRRPPLAAVPALLANQPNIRRIHFSESGLSAVQAQARAQAMTDAANDAVTADGELDALRYGAVLEARGIVGLRGAGVGHDGLWYVKRVTHNIRRGSYRQRFSLAREGQGSTVPVVRP